MRNQLGEVKMNTFTLSRVRNHALIVGMNNNTTTTSEEPKKDYKDKKQAQTVQDYSSNLTSSQALIQYMPKRNHKSVILSDLQLSNLISCFPNFYRSCDWERVFTRDEDGCSLITFF
mmetsp:Transcript_33615/g.51785  ORF Transcript_33615/g.51785 Transcript_33615/m.51785 type:complete len:117 (+) Transcript_33615:1743-2093(+)